MNVGTFIADQLARLAAARAAPRLDREVCLVRHARAVELLGAGEGWRLSLDPADRPAPGWSYLERFT